MSRSAGLTCTEPRLDKSELPELLGLLKQSSAIGKQEVADGNDRV